MTLLRVYKQFFNKWGFALLLMAGIFFFSSLPSVSIPSLGALDWLVKKTGHFLVYGLLACSYLRGLSQRGLLAHLIAWGLAVLYALSDEFHQWFVPGRGNSLVDVGIDALGAVSGLGVLALWQKRRHPK